MTLRKALILVMYVSILPSIASAQNAGTRLTAPTFYIAASAEFSSPNYLFIRGASNLPTGAQLLLNIYDFAGQGSSVLNQDTHVTVGKDGLFEVKTLPKPGVQFRHNLVCEVLFMSTFPPQKQSVLRATGKMGGKLAFNGRNPQAKVSSGGYYLSELIHVP